MYQLDPKSLQALRGTRWSGIGANVFFLGLTSLLTDVSSEMVTSILPIYMVFALRLTPLQYGLIDGVQQGASAVVRLAAGLMADRWQRNRDVAASGYALSAVCKLGLLAAGNAWGGIMAATALDRFGKGIRTAPRDALISMSSEPEKLGLAFGVHRAMDTAGALLGPLVAFGVLAMLPDAYDVIFVASFCVAIVGLAAILLFVKDVRSEPQAGIAARPSIGSALGLLRSPSFRAVTLAGSALGLVTVADSFFYLVIQRRDSITLSTFPLLYVATAVTYLVFAIPAGRLCDRVGRGRVFLLGHVLLLGASTSLLLSGPGVLSGVLSLGLLGAYYACTDGVLMAAVTPLVPAHLRATGLSILTTAIGVARLCASVAFGAIWNGWGIETALAMFCIGLAVALALTYRTLFPL